MSSLLYHYIIISYTVRYIVYCINYWIQPGHRYNIVYIILLHILSLGGHALTIVYKREALISTAIMTVCIKVKLGSNWCICCFRTVIFDNVKYEFLSNNIH